MLAVILEEDPRRPRTLHGLGNAEASELTTAAHDREIPELKHALRPQFNREPAVANQPTSAFKGLRAHRITNLSGRLRSPRSRLGCGGQCDRNGAALTRQLHQRSTGAEVLCGQGAVGEAQCPAAAAPTATNAPGGCKPPGPSHGPAATPRRWPADDAAAGHARRVPCDGPSARSAPPDQDLRNRRPGEDVVELLKQQRSPVRAIR